MDTSDKPLGSSEGTPLNERISSLFGGQLQVDGKAAEDGEESAEDNDASSTRDGIRHLGKKFKRMLGSDEKSPSPSSKNTLFSSIKSDVVFNPARVERELDLRPSRSKSAGDRTKDVLASTASILTHPRKTIKQKVKSTAAGKISSTQRPFASQRAELEYLEVQEALTQSETSQSSSQTSSDVEGGPVNKSQLLDDRRESIRAAWTTSRLRRIRVVPKGHLKFPNKRAFEERDEASKVVRFRWEKWVGNMLLYYTQNFTSQYVDEFEELPFDIDTFRTYAERLVMETGHWQTWLMQVRSVYRWEDPILTGKWLALYTFLWYTNHIMGFVYGYLIYRVVRNRYYPSTLRHLQASADRAADSETVAFQLGELIERHGQGEWLDPLVESLGPFAQLQLGDIANILEVMHNFYSWKSPWKTLYSLCFFAACLLVSLLASLDFSVKILWFIIGCSFFFCWPIASRYPQYRYLVSPVKWVLWDIPTHTEWSFQYLRKQAQITREAIIERKVEDKYTTNAKDHVNDRYLGQIETSHPHLTLDGADDNFSNTSSESEDWESATSASSILSEDDITSFRAHWKGTPGRLTVYASGVYFVRTFPRQIMWDVPFMQLEEIWKDKAEKHRKLTLQGLQDDGEMHLKSTSGDIWTLNPMKDRDEAFNAIVGFSGLQWQSLQTEPGKGRKPKKGSSTLGL